MRQIFRQWAGQIEQVRGAILTGSRTDPNGHIDWLSDFDIMLFVRSPQLFEKPGWEEELGPVMVCLPEGVRLPDGLWIPTRLVVYSIGQRIDFSIWPLESVPRLSENGEVVPWLDNGYEVLLDKDGLFEALPPATYQCFVPDKPGQKEFQALVEEFFWEATVVAKYLWRKELSPALFSFETVMRQKCLLQMFNWHIQQEGEWQVPALKMGRGLKRKVDAKEWKRYKKTLFQGKASQNWAPFFEMVALFGEISRSVARDVGLEYPEKVEEEVTRFLQQIKDKE